MKIKLFRNNSNLLGTEFVINDIIECGRRLDIPLTTPVRRIEADIFCIKDGKRVFYDVKKKGVGNFTVDEIERVKIAIERDVIDEAVFPIQNGGNFPAGEKKPIRQAVESANAQLNAHFGTTNIEYIYKIDAGDF